MCKTWPLNYAHEKRLDTKDIMRNDTTLHMAGEHELSRKVQKIKFYGHVKSKNKIHIKRRISEMAWMDDKCEVEQGEDEWIAKQVVLDKGYVSK